MKRVILILGSICVIGGCGSFGSDAELEGTYKDCFWASEIHTRYTFSSDGGYSYVFDDHLEGVKLYKSGTWRVSDGFLLLSVLKIGKTEESSKDTSNLVEQYLFSHDADYDCIRLGNRDELCHEGNCLF